MRPGCRRRDRFERWAGQDVLEIGVGLGSDHLQFARRWRPHARARSVRRAPAPHAAPPRASRLARPRRAWAMPNAIPGRMQLRPRLLIRRAASHAGYRQARCRRCCACCGRAVGADRPVSPRFLVLSGWDDSVAGILRLGLFLKGRRRLLSEIEYRSSDNDALPLVKVYSRSQARRLFADFDTVSVRVHHVDAGHFPPPLSYAAAHGAKAAAGALAALRWLVRHCSRDQTRLRRRGRRRCARAAYRAPCSRACASCAAAWSRVSPPHAPGTAGSGPVLCGRDGGAPSSRRPEFRAWLEQRISRRARSRAHLAPCW